MRSIRRDELPKQHLKGRCIQSAVGRDAALDSEKMTVGFATYSAQSGPMEPHHHAEETILVLDAKDSFVRWGGAPDALEHTMELAPGMTLHFSELEWHVFEYREGGYLDIAFIYGQVDNIRPEQILAQPAK